MKHIELRYQAIGFSAKITVDLEKTIEYKDFVEEVIAQGYKEFNKDEQDLYFRSDGENIDLESSFGEFKSIVEEMPKIKLYIFDREYSEKSSNEEEKEDAESNEVIRFFIEKMVIRKIRR